jgi:hypothetical protein
MWTTKDFRRGLGSSFGSFTAKIRGFFLDFTIRCRLDFWFLLVGILMFISILDDYMDLWILSTGVKPPKGQDYGRSSFSYVYDRESWEYEKECARNFM